MPWSAVPKFPEVMARLREKREKGPWTSEELYTEIQRVTGLMRAATIKNCMESMVRLEHVHIGDGGNFFPGPQTRIHDGELEAEAEKLISEYLPPQEPEVGK